MALLETALLEIGTEQPQTGSATSQHSAKTMIRSQPTAHHQQSGGSGTFIIPFGTLKKPTLWTHGTQKLVAQASPTV